MSTLSQEVVGLKDAVPKIEAVAKQFSDPESGSASSLNEVLYYLCEEITGRCAEFKDWEMSLSSEAEVDVSKSSGTDSQDFAESVESLLATILLAVQNVLKRVSGGEAKQDQADPNADGRLPICELCIDNFN